jgi:DNA-binding transcriptional regulator LsrR (DeoR family)
MLQLRREDGLTIEAIARRFGVSRRTVFRVLARGRDQEVARW